MGVKAVAYLRGTMGVTIAFLRRKGVWNAQEAARSQR